MVITQKTILDIYDSVLEKNNLKALYYGIHFNTYRSGDGEAIDLNGKHIKIAYRDLTLKDLDITNEQYESLYRTGNITALLLNFLKNNLKDFNFKEGDAYRLRLVDEIKNLVLTDATTGEIVFDSKLNDDNPIFSDIVVAIKDAIETKVFGKNNSVYMVNGVSYLNVDNGYAVRIIPRENENDAMINRLKHFTRNDFDKHLNLSSIVNNLRDLNLDVKPLTLKNDIVLSSLDFENCATENLNKVFVGRNGNYYGYFEIDQNDTEITRCNYSNYILTNLDDFFNEREYYNIHSSSVSGYISNYMKQKYIRYCGCGNTYSLRDNKGCSRCIGTATRYDLDLSRYLSKTFDIESYYSKPTLQFVKGENEITDNPLYLGVELEVDTDYENTCGCGDDDCDECNGGDDYDHRFNSNVVLHKMNLKDIENPHIFAKQDGSLDSGFELVSQPLTLKAHLENKTIDWLNGISLLKRFDYASHNKGTCGLHVHINRDFFGKSTSAQLYNGAKVVYLMEKHWDSFVKFSRRKANHLERWAKKENAKNDFDRVNVKTTRTLSSAFTKNYYRPRNKYVALNTLHDATFEFRIFRGTLNEKTFKATLQFVDNLARLVRRTSLKNLTSISFEDIINYKKYPELQSYYTSRFMNDLLGGDND